MQNLLSHSSTSVRLEHIATLCLHRVEWYNSESLKFIGLSVFKLWTWLQNLHVKLVRGPTYMAKTNRLCTTNFVLVLPSVKVMGEQTEMLMETLSPSAITVVKV